MDYDELQQHAQRALDAAIRMDQRAVDEAVTPLLREGDPGHIFLWVLGMITVSAQGIEPGSLGVVHQARVGRFNPATGQMDHPPIDEAPHGVRAYARIAAAYLNDDKPTSHAVWKALIEDPNDPEGEQILACMALALQSAAHRVRSAQATNN